MTPGQMYRGNSFLKRLKRLEQMGLVQRRRAQADEREVHLALSETGSALRAQVPPLRARLLCQFDDQDLLEMEGLRRSLDRLLMRLSE